MKLQGKNTLAAATAICMGAALAASPAGTTGSAIAAAVEQTVASRSVDTPGVGQIDVSLLIVGSFLLLNIGVMVRVFGPAAWPEQYAVWVDASAGLWVLAFGLFAYQYVPLLLRPRVDGKPG